MDFSGSSGSFDGKAAREPLATSPRVSPPPPPPVLTLRRTGRGLDHGSSGLEAGLGLGSGIGGAGGTTSGLEDPRADSYRPGADAYEDLGDELSSSTTPQDGSAHDEDLSVPTSRASPRVYEVWHRFGGKNRFLCGGRCITGPPNDFGFTCCAWSSILLPTAFYFAVCARYFWVDLDMWPLPVLTGLIFLTTVFFFLLTECTDPGILPRFALQASIGGLGQEVAEVTGLSPLSLNLEAGGNGAPVLPDDLIAAGFRYCTSCKIVRPPGTTHCRDCDNCVMQFDHHCPFVNNCVGKRNYGYFNAFLWSVLCLAFAVIAGIAIWGVHASASAGDDEVKKGAWMTLLMFVIGIPTGIMSVGVVILLSFHIGLQCAGKTTKECCKGRPGTVSGTVAQHICGGRRGHSLIHLRDRVSGPMI